jgi:pheromone shutdown protein TraB
MTVAELIAELQKCAPEAQVKFLYVAERNHYFAVNSVETEDDEVILKDY